MTRAYPFPPARMDADMAAYYIGVSRTKFLRKVSDGSYPPSVSDGGNRLWLRSDLDGYITRRHNLPANEAGLSVEDQIDQRSA